MSGIDRAQIRGRCQPGVQRARRRAVVELMKGTPNVVLARVQTWASFVRFSHSLFALPFALTGALLAARVTPVTTWQVAWIVVAMVAARSAAMGFNRLVDAGGTHATREPRRARYRASHLPSSGDGWIRGVVSRVRGRRRAVNGLCLALSPVALAIVFWYSLAKRYTAWTQAFLGLAMAVAPVGGWLAAGGRGGWEPWLLGLAIGLWVGGFDVLYACQDLEFDRAHGLRSIPVRFGLARRCLSRARCT